MPNVQDSDTRGYILLSPIGNQTGPEHILISKNKNFDPPAKNAIITDGNSTNGQKKHDDIGVKTNNHIVI